MNFIPNGYRKIEAYTNGKEIVAVEWPEDEDENHNCDALGCSTLWHVKYRVDIPDWQAVQKQPTPKSDSAEGKSMDRDAWLDASKIAPPPNSDCRKLVWIVEDEDVGYIGIRAYHHETGTWLANGKVGYGVVTHWRHLPEHPESGQEVQTIARRCHREFPRFGGVDAIRAKVLYGGKKRATDTEYKSVSLAMKFKLKTEREPRGETPKLHRERKQSGK